MREGVQLSELWKSQGDPIKGIHSGPRTIPGESVWSRKDTDRQKVLWKQSPCYELSGCGLSSDMIVFGALRLCECLRGCHQAHSHDLSTYTQVSFGRSRRRMARPIWWWKIRWKNGGNGTRKWAGMGVARRGMVLLPELIRKLNKSFLKEKIRHRSPGGREEGKYFLEKGKQFHPYECTLWPFGSQSLGSASESEGLHKSAYPIHLWAPL